MSFSNLESILDERDHRIAKLEKKVANLTEEKAEDKKTINNLLRKNEKLESQYREIEFQNETLTRSLETAFSLTAMLCPQCTGSPPETETSSSMDIVEEVVEDATLEDTPQHFQPEIVEPATKQSEPATTSLSTTVNIDKKEQGTQTENPQKRSRTKSNSKENKQTPGSSKKVIKTTKKLIETTKGSWKNTMIINRGKTLQGISNFLKESVKTTLSKASDDEFWGRDSRRRDSEFVLVKVLSHISKELERNYVAKVTGTRILDKQLLLRVDFLMKCRGVDYVFTKNEGEVGYEINGENVQAYLPRPEQINGKFEKYCWGKNFDFSKYAIAQN